MEPIVIVVPIYKKEPSKSEQKAFRQCVHTLKEHPICLVTYAGLDISWYLTELGETTKYFTQFFSKEYFTSLQGYNQLMMSKGFYMAFIQYEYMLIYQLDAWIFRDDVLLWCDKGYDYVGAPWFEDNLSHEQGKELWMVGNGGFSLRKIKTFIKLFEEDKYLHPISYYISSVVHGRLPLDNLWHQIRKRDRFNDYIKKWKDAEDLFYCAALSGTACALNIPACEEALSFAWEQSPQYLMDLCKQILMGCHGWDRYDSIFWANYID